MTYHDGFVGDDASSGPPSQSPTGWRRRLICNPGLLLLLPLLAGITFVHYSHLPDQAAIPLYVIGDLGLSRYDFERLLYVIPLVWSGFLFGRKGVIVTAAVVLAGMLPRGLFLSPHPPESLFEAGAVLTVGAWAGLSAALLVSDRDRHLEMAAVYRMSGIVAGSLELTEILESGIANVVHVLKPDAVLIFLKDEETGDLKLTAHLGISRPLAEACRRLPEGKSLNGVVARTGGPLFIKDTLKEPRLTVAAAREARIRSQLIVPLRARGKVLGTLCVATYSRRRLRPGELELLTTIGNHIGVAVEKARLYARTQRMEESLRHYLHEITRAQEEERLRIARELHDDTVQALVIHSRRLDALASSGGECADNWQAPLEELRQETNAIIEGVRRLGRDLRPPILDRLGLLPALERLARDVTEHSRIRVRVERSGAERRLGKEEELALYRIAQEALRNVWRHSGASESLVKVDFAPSRLRLAISDDGVGFVHPSNLVDLSRSGQLGLAGIEERTHLLGGVLAVDSVIGRGTTLSIEVPLDR